MSDGDGIAVFDDAGRSRFEARVDGEHAGFAAYQLRDDGAYAFTHTEVDDRFGGRGVGSALIRSALDELRGRDVAVLPYCPFVKAYIARHPGYRDLVPAHLHERFGLAGPG